ncbi:Hermansky-Pudlak syndrome 1 protein homolog [Cimex lectularius]|uniref:Hermansky-Pudlak syndrome 1 protein homolog n=1 Tax=Cimex lectularius TaxID=79782 RepID=A0A8I6S149_CIMLE|nr:Hermansky-Pudlak syndrome 1 protein homolog [Cimex lectularius]XP_014255013.1 Hermansky-Pudlak syndrome 1 protein homolog [Cimex lectularius]
MRCILVFDQVNDIVFSKSDEKFVAHVEKLAKYQAIDRQRYMKEDGELDLNYIMQLFAPIVTSQRFMSSQFGNSYMSIQCEDGLNMVFDEYMGYLFVHFGFEEVQWLKRMLGICISIIQHLCGPDVSMLKENQSRSILVIRLLNTWENLASHSQATLLEALEQITLDGNINAHTVNVIKEATDKIKSSLDQPKSHALIFIENKFFTLYSSRSAKDLSARDMLFLSLLAKWHQTEMANRKAHSNEEECDITECGVNNPQSQKLPEINNGKYDDILLLSGNNFPAISPYIVNVSLITEEVSLILLYESQYCQLSQHIYEVFEAINVINSVSTCSTELASMKRGMEQLDPAVKKVFDSIKKLKQTDVSPNLEGCVKVMHVKLDLLKRQWTENSATGNLASISSCTHSFVYCLRDLLRFTVYNKYIIWPKCQVTHLIAHRVTTSLTDFKTFLKVKGLENFTMASTTTLSINKYIEDFPGLVHFLFIDRINHRIITPNLELRLHGIVPLTKQKIWSMIEFSRIHLQEGHLALMWRDTTFNYSYYLWFEDASGSQLKPKVSTAQAVKGLPLPGVFSGDFYKRLFETCFPKTSLSKIRCYELYCIHLGLATSSCILEQSRRLAATVWEVTGLPHNPLDLL